MNELIKPWNYKLNFQVKERNDDDDEDEFIFMRSKGCKDRDCKDKNCNDKDKKMEKKKIKLVYKQRYFGVFSCFKNIITFFLACSSSTSDSISRQSGGSKSATHKRVDSGTFIEMSDMRGRGGLGAGTQEISEYSQTTKI